MTVDESCNSVGSKVAVTGPWSSSDLHKKGVIVALDQFVTPKGRMVGYAKVKFTGGEVKWKAFQTLTKLEN